MRKVISNCTAVIGIILSLSTMAAEKPAAETVTESTAISIPFFTTRKRDSSDNGIPRYSTDVADLSAGRCEVVVSGDEKLNAENGPVAAEPVESVVASLAAVADQGVLVYVHGYNIGLDRACREAAQLSVRTSFVGRTLLWSWPASRALVTYRKDERRLLESMSAILESLDLLGDRLGYANVSILAHSMGTRIVPPALQQTRGDGQRFRRLILIASDLDLETFEGAVPRLPTLADSTAVLVSGSDRLLALSKIVNGEGRLGQATELDASGVELVDVSDLGNLGLNGHNYHLDSPEVGKVLKRLLKSAHAN